MKGGALKYKIDDDGTIKTNFFMTGKTINDTTKEVTEVVMEYCLANPTATMKSPTDTQREIQNIVKDLKAKHGKLRYDDMVAAFEATGSYEHLMSYLLTGFMGGLCTDIMKVLMHTYGRALSLADPNEWLDNFRINNYGYPLNMIMWHKYNSDKIYTVKQQEPLPINTSVRLKDAKRVYELLVTSFRGALLTSNVFTPAVQVSNTDYERLCDECYKQYAICYGGSHGCDVFTIPDMSLSVEEIRIVLDRYPSWRICYVLNHSTYASHSGTHWVAIEFTKGCCKMICSQRSTFSSFKDGGQFMSSLTSNGFRLEWNKINIQNDNCNCGLYAPLALFMLIIYDGDITNAVTQGIGDNGSKIHGKNYSVGSIGEFRTRTISRQ